MSQDALISIVVPVYKVEAFLDKCVQSIVDQTYKNLEIILVDDGSPDRCGEMCDAWAAKDSRIKVIHKENGGGAQARNVGLEHASGRYIGFADSDDYLLPDMYRRLLTLLSETNSDIAECGYYTVESDDFTETIQPDHNISVYDPEQALRENIRDNVCRQLVWNKLYARHTLDGVRFVEHKFIDDEFFTYRALGQAKKVAVTQQKFYCYRQQQGSAMHQSYSVKWLDAVEAKKHRLEYLSCHYPALLPGARIDYFFTCFYHGQKALTFLKGETQMSALTFLTEQIRACPLPPKAAFQHLSFMHKCWLLLAKFDLILCCRIRNLLKIGI